MVDLKLQNYIKIEDNGVTIWEQQSGDDCRAIADMARGLQSVSKSFSHDTHRSAHHPTILGAVTGIYNTKISHIYTVEITHPLHRVNLYSNRRLSLRKYQPHNLQSNQLITQLVSRRGNQQYNPRGNQQGSLPDNRPCSHRNNHHRNHPLSQ